MTVRTAAESSAMHFHTDPVTSAEHIPPKSAAVPYSGVSADMSEVRNGDSVPPIFTLVIRKPAAAEAMTAHIFGAVCTRG